jgi:uncharacterized protein DUF4402
MRLTPLLVLAALLATSRPAGAQITVTPVRDLAFGPVIVGVPTQIGPSHPVRSGQFRVTTVPLVRVRLRFTLPNQLDGPAGATMPISFSNNDALHVGSAPNSVPETFNPKATRNVQITTDPTLFVFIGGTVSPAANQAQGNYAGTITLTVNIF